MGRPRSMQTDARTQFFGVHARVAQAALAIPRDHTLQIDIEGAIRAGKTTLCLTIIDELSQRYPGIHGLTCRFSDGDTDEILKPRLR